jgi:hypothetical protein
MVYGMCVYENLSLIQFYSFLSFQDPLDYVDPNANKPLNDCLK